MAEGTGLCNFAKQYPKRFFDVGIAEQHAVTFSSGLARNGLIGTLHTVAQDELIGDAEPTPAPKIFKETCRIDWTRGASEIHNLVRGLSPYPAAWSVLENDATEMGSVKIFETEISDRSDLKPGEIETDGNAMTVGCGDRAISVKSLQLQGKRRMDTSEFLRGCRLSKPRFV